MSINRTTIYREYILPTIQTAASFATCIAALHSVKLVSVFHDWYTQAGCQSSMQSPTCASYTTAEVLAGAVAIVGVLGLLKISAAHCPQARIHNPSVIPSGSEQPLPPSFFRSQQNGGPARYAEDDLQGTHRRPLGNYDPVRWEGGSQSI